MFYAFVKEESNMKTFIKLSAVVYAAVGAFLLLSPKEIFPSFYKPIVMSSLAFTSALLIFLPKLIFQPRGDKEKEKILLKLQTTIAVVVIMNGLGGLGLYKLYLVGFGYDKLMHFLSPLLIALVGSEFIKIWFKKKSGYATATSALLVIFGGVVWEILEAVSDKFFGTTFLGGGDSIYALDTKQDLLMNVLGVLLGVVLLRKKSIHRGLPR